MKPCKYHVFVCRDERCDQCGSKEVYEKFRELNDKLSLTGVKITSCGSMGYCDIGPNVVIYPDGVWYSNVKPDDVDGIVESHLINGAPYEPKTLKEDDPSEGRKENFFKEVLKMQPLTWDSLLSLSRSKGLGDGWLERIKYYFDEIAGTSEFKVKERVARRRFEI